MENKDEVKRKDFAFRVLKSLRNCILLAACGFLPLTLSAADDFGEAATTQQQTVRISGKVTDASGEALLGASVVEKGSQNGAATD